MGFFKKNKSAFLGILIGMIGGYLYWHYVGCLSGTCAITSNPVNSTLYCALMGGLIGSIFKKDNKAEISKNAG